MVITVRDGQKVWPMCPECGCRLKINGNIASHWYGKIAPIDEASYEVLSDARGCKCTRLVDFWFIDNRSVAQFG